MFPLRHIARASSSPMLSNTVLTRSQLGMAEPEFETTTLRLDSWSGFELHFWPHKSAQLPTDPTDPLHLSVSSQRTLRLRARAHVQASTASAILKYQPPTGITCAKERMQTITVCQLLYIPLKCLIQSLKDRL